jgi:osmotically-inducible protein OsmY
VSRSGQYTVARISRALAEDPRTGELGVEVRVDGQTVTLRGEVACPARRAEVLAVVREHADGRAVRDDLRVADVREPVEHEELR